MKKLRIPLIFALLFSFVMSEAQSQYFSKFETLNNWSAGLTLGGASLQGDGGHAGIGFTGGAHAKYSVSPTFGLQLSGDFGSLKGGDGYSLAEANTTYSYKNSFASFDATSVFTLGNTSFFKSLRKSQVYALFGVGVILNNVEGDYVTLAEANKYGSNSIKTSHTSPALTIPFGFGVKRSINDKIDLGLEMKIRYTNSDSLDALADEVWNNRNEDFFSTIGLRVSYKFGSEGDETHYDWVNPLETIYADLDTMKEITNKLKTLIEDEDGDGVGDFFDIDNTTEEGVNTYGNGKAVDSDGDGVPDHLDKQPLVFAKNVDVNGVAVDADGDGVIDELDEDTNTPAGALVDAKGNEIKVGGGNCCDCENVSLPTIIFDNGSSKIAPSSYGVLYALAEKMKQCPSLSVDATGYTASKSGEQLAWKRTNAIIDHLEANYGIERSRVTSVYASGSGVEYSTRRIELSMKK
ncbi:MAG TPA: hypothetical protein DCY51_00275 [Bacteroidetes bacterium]|nr:hypothetical protein [Bacteroidota bacterium]